MLDSRDSKLNSSCKVYCSQDLSQSFPDGKYVLKDTIFPLRVHLCYLCREAYTNCECGSDMLCKHSYNIIKHFAFF